MKNLLLVLLLFGNSFSLLAQENPIVLITYYSQSGNTKTLAEAIQKGAQSVNGVEVKLLAIEEVEVSDLLAASAILVGSPVYNANIATPVQEFINSWPFEGRPLKNKIGAAFATGGGISIGEEGVMIDILRSMLIHGMIVMGGEEVESAFGASAITGEGSFSNEKMDEIFLNKGFGLGKRVAEAVLRFNFPEK
ncbi:NAD(P)H dehydrogenase (quinone) [Algoriphagus boseongensis]|uniref:NAD(P)H dehydrogenase (Quinone) n=1 Tax=Algoriphagus boseongensis TaxID=1442587 RepID=A0A4R6T816_9BACT|nr:NAD(P)H-dependent oxidoreductase [Algoriphagus boseongensis]TDQ17395.1 NAD(P)H dehydrogenase (quinone) [Algoriphagus boseongensis]